MAVVLKASAPKKIEHNRWSCSVYKVRANWKSNNVIGIAMGHTKEVAAARAAAILAALEKHEGVTES